MARDSKQIINNHGSIIALFSNKTVVLAAYLSDAYPVECLREK